MYAFVDVNQYQIVGTGNSVEAAREDYISKLKTENVSNEEAKPETAEGVIEKINSAVIDGNTIYYIKLISDEKVYTARVTVSDLLPFTESGQEVTLTINGTSVTKIEYK